MTTTALLSDGPEITTSNSLPFSLDTYQLAGVVDAAQFAATASDQSGNPPKLTVTAAPRAETKTYPLISAVSDSFPRLSRSRRSR
jgi:hypothetical protein